MKVAVCISGQCRGLEHCHQSIKDNVLDVIGEHDLFLQVADDEDAYKAETFFKPAAINIEKDQKIPDEKIKRQENRHLQQYLQQIHGMKRVNDLRIAYEREHNFEYDWIIRCRFDIYFFCKIPPLADYDINRITIPDFHWWSIVSGAGYNDRFAVGNRKNMDIYLRVFDSVNTYAAEKYLFKYRLIHPESTLRHHLDVHGIKVTPAHIRFGRMRKNNELLDTHIANEAKTWPRVERAINTQYLMSTLRRFFVKPTSMDKNNYQAGGKAFE